MTNPSEIKDPAERHVWRDISTAPALERVFVAGWQPPSGTMRGYWWTSEDVTDEHGVPMAHPSVLKWQPIPLAPQDAAP